VHAVAVECMLSLTSIQLFCIDWDNYKRSWYFFFLFEKVVGYVNLLLVGDIEEQNKLYEP
jgi:hypothetical protein